MSQKAHYIFNKYAGYYLYSAATIFLLTGLAKIYSAFGSSNILLYPDPLFGISFKLLFIFIGLLELILSFLCFLFNGILERALIIIWLSICFIIYRLCLLAMGYHKPCKCLGDLASRLNISDSSADIAMQILLFYLIVGSCILVYLNKDKVVKYFELKKN